jgi:hypothetical protein
MRLSAGHEVALGPVSLASAGLEGRPLTRFLLDLVAQLMDRR